MKKTQLIPITLMACLSLFCLSPSLHAEDDDHDDDHYEEHDEDIAADWHEVEAFMRQHAPDVLALLVEVEQIDPEAAEELRHEIAEHFHHFEELLAEDPEAFQREKAAFIADIRFQMLVHRTQQAEGAERERLLVELRQALERRFDQAVQDRRAEIAELTAEIAGLKQEVDDAVANRSALIERRMKDLTEEDDDEFDW